MIDALMNFSLYLQSHPDTIFVIGVMYGGFVAWSLARYANREEETKMRKQIRHYQRELAKRNMQ